MTPLNRLYCTLPSPQLEVSWKAVRLSHGDRSQKPNEMQHSSSFWFLCCWVELGACFPLLSGPAFKPNQFFSVPPIGNLRSFPLYLWPTCCLHGGQHGQLISASSSNDQIGPAPTACRPTSSQAVPDSHHSHTLDLSLSSCLNCWASDSEISTLSRDSHWFQVLSGRLGSGVKMKRNLFLQSSRSATK